MARRKKQRLVEIAETAAELIQHLTSRGLTCEEGIGALRVAAAMMDALRESPTPKMPAPNTALNTGETL